MESSSTLHRFLVAVGVVVVVLAALVLDVVLYVTWRSHELDSLQQQAASQAHLVEVGADRLGIDGIVPAFDDLGLAVVVHQAGGSEQRSQTAPDSLPAEGWLTTDVELAGGVRATVAVDRAPIEQALRRLLLIEAMVTVLAASLAGLVLWKVIDRVLAPLVRMVGTIRRQTAGRRGERLETTRCECLVGELGQAYDEMVETLETTLAQSEAAEQRSRVLQQQTEQIIDTANDAFVAVDSTGTVLHWNDRAERTFGWLRSDALGRPLAEVTGLDPGSGWMARALEASDAEDECDWPQAADCRHRSGNCFPVELTAWSTAGGDDGKSEVTINAFVRDVSERRRAEEERARMASIVASTGDAIVGTGSDHRIASWNPAAEYIFGFTAAEVVGRPLVDLVPSGLVLEVSDKLQGVRRGETLLHHETTWRHRDAGTVEVGLTISPIRDSVGKVVGASAIARDITERRRMAAALEATLVDLRNALELTRRSEARSRRFLADAAHQIRTPIAGIQACAETLLRRSQEGGAQSERLLSEMLTETSRAGRLIRGLLQAARLDKGLTLQPVPCDLVALCHNELERTQRLAPHLALSTQTMGWNGKRPVLDGWAVQEIVANLLDNARRHAITNIAVTVRRTGPLIEVMVADDGPGLAGEQVVAAFDRFVSLDGQGGSGLGLAIARGLAEAHRGGLHYVRPAFILTLPWTPEVSVAVGHSVPSLVAAGRSRD